LGDRDWKTGVVNLYWEVFERPWHFLRHL